MFRYLSMLMLAFCLCASTSYAIEPSIGLIVPYKVECVKQPDGTSEIRMSVLLRKAKKALTVEGILQTIVDGVNNPITHILQSKDGCEVLDALFTNTGKLYGHEAIQVGEDLENVLFNPGTSAPGNQTGTLCAYLMRLELCCGQSTFDALKDIVFIDDESDVVWVDLGTLTSNSSSALSAAPYSTDSFLTTSFFSTGTGPNISVRVRIVSTALLNLHGKTCCLETFGLSDDAAQGVLMQIIQGLETTPGTFTAMGTWGSCGDTAKVKVTGNRTSQVRIDICGKTFCLLEDLSVAASTEPIGFIQSTTPNQSTARCFMKFMADYTNFGLTTVFYKFDPPFGTHGLQYEICRLVQGVDVVNNTTQEERFQLRLVCIDQETGTYEFAVTRVIENGLTTFIRMLGCRLRLIECPKCCK